MEGAHLRLFEITQSVQGDPLGNALMDEVLTACFDHALGSRGALERLVTALNRFNSHLSGYARPVSFGLFRGTPEEVSVWAEQLTSQILSNSEH
jgi:hypothetical protein